MHVGGGADRSTSRADPPQGADGDHRAGEGDPAPCVRRSAVPIRSMSSFTDRPAWGKTAAARLILEEAKAREESPFRQKAKFVEIDATALQFDERNIADPLLGSVHDPIYRGAGAFWQVGIPQPRSGGGDVPRALFGLYGNARAKYAGADRRDRSAWQILPVGGVEDKLEAAQQAGATLALIPRKTGGRSIGRLRSSPSAMRKRSAAGFPAGEGGDALGGHGISGGTGDRITNRRNGANA